MSEMDAYRQVFLAESAEYVQQITEGLLTLERKPGDLGPVEVIFRGAHSLKSMSAAMGFCRTADLTHAMESLMTPVRSGERGVDTQVVTAMLEAVDLVRDLIADEDEGGTTLDAAEMISRLGELTTACSGRTPAAHDAEGHWRAVGAADGSPAPCEDDEPTTTIDVALVPECSLRGVRAYLVLKRLNQLGRVVETVPSAADLEDERFDSHFSVMVATSLPAESVREAVLGVSEVAGATVRVDAHSRKSSPPAAESVFATASAGEPRLPRLSETQTVRVPIPRLDALLDLVGEIVILRSRFDRLLKGREDPELEEIVSDMHRTSKELQFEVLQTRMVPVGSVFSRFPRMVRDLAVELDKRVVLEPTGLDIELDRTVLDEICDPLVHLLRNSIDHGVESEEVRVATGKPAEGTITLAVSRERDHVAIVVADDGRGIDPGRVWEEACREGLALPDEREGFSEAEILLFTCVPGFSTAEKTTRVSGRGVGLDVVKDRVEALGGTLQIASRVGEGSRFTLRLPLTLAIIKALLVESHGQPFALPLASVNEVLSADEVHAETNDGSPVIVGHGSEAVPLVRLGSVLFGDLAAGPLPAHTSIVLVTPAGGGMHALSVDRLLGRQEIVVKPLSGMFDSTRGFSGATILGDGRVMLILDPRSLLATQEALR